MNAATAVDRLLQGALMLVLVTLTQQLRVMIAHVNLLLAQDVQTTMLAILTIQLPLMMDLA